MSYSRSELRKKRRAGIAKVVKFKSLLAKYHYGMTLRASWNADHLSKLTPEDDVVMLYIRSFAQLDGFKKLWRSSEFCTLFFEQCRYHNIRATLPETLSEYG